MVLGWSIVQVDYSVKDYISIIIGEDGSDSPSIIISSLRVGGSNEAGGGIERARRRADGEVQRGSSRGLFLPYEIHISPKHTDPSFWLSVLWT